MSPTTASGGAQVTISGSGFGTARGTGSVWLGSTYGTVVGRSDTQIVATVAFNAQTGTARVQQSGIWPNAPTFNVNTATISNVNPTSGVPGTLVTITGSGFGAAQGNGQVWVGTALGVVQSWSDSQIVAQVAPGAAYGSGQLRPRVALSPDPRLRNAEPSPRAAGGSPGNVRILQNGVWSNQIPFAVNVLNIASATPTSGGSGTTVTITGTGFGSSQGTGTLILGSINGQVSSWTDTQIVAAVAPGSLTGVARVQQNGVWSNTVGFTVPGGNISVLPSALNMVVGDSGTLQALNSGGQPVKGLMWTTTDPTVVSLSTDDPPVLPALAPGHVTITAGSASADVLVLAADPNTGGLPTGSVVWSNPAAQVTSIVPAVPSSTGVADVFSVPARRTVGSGHHQRWRHGMDSEYKPNDGPCSRFPGWPRRLSRAEPERWVGLDRKTGWNDRADVTAVHAERELKVQSRLSSVLGPASRRNYHLDPKRHR